MLSPAPPADMESGTVVAQKRLLSPLLLKKVPPLPREDERRPYAQSTTNVFSSVFFWWLSPVLSTGYKRTLQPEDLFTLTDDIKIETMCGTFYAHLKNRMITGQRAHVADKIKLRGETATTSSKTEAEDLEDYKLAEKDTIWALFLTFKWQYLSACLFLAIANGASTASPLLTKKLIRFVELHALGLENSMGKGSGYAVGSSLMVAVIGLFINHFFYRAMLTGAQVKAVLTKAILDKSFKLDAEGKNKYPSGKITSMMGTDLARIDFAIGFQPFAIIFPIPVAIAIAILIYNIGVSALVGIGMLLFFMVFMAFSAKKLFKYRSKANKYTDSRVNYIKEVLNNLKIIKYYSWEPPYHENISDIRRKEMGIIFRMQGLRNLILGFALSLTLFSSMATFLVLYRVGLNKRDPASIFSSISLFNVLTQQVIMLPMAIASGTDAYVGLTRVGEFLSAGEVDLEANRIEITDDKVAARMQRENLAISVENASFEWETFEAENEDQNEDDKTKKDGKSQHAVLQHKLELENNESSTKSITDQSSMSSATLEKSSFPGLQNIDFTIKKGEFVVVTGLIGSGKTSLLNALSGFMKRTGGDVNANGSLLMCGYPWVQNATVKDNILFGLELNEQRYKDVVYACSLESDFEILPAGDKTEIGERGITLSGGQKARINLARAVYAQNDIILLDDVLSAVDARVGKHIMDNCILGLLKDKTRVLATHQLSLIGSADRIIFLNGDGSIDMGDLETLKRNNLAFSNLMTYNSEVKDEEEKEEEADEEEADEKKLVERQATRVSQAPDEEAIHHDLAEGNAADGKLHTQEDRAVNAISGDIYMKYFRAGSGFFGGYGILVFLGTTTILATFSLLFTNTWLSFWTADKFAGKSDRFYIGFYVMFTVLAFIFLITEFLGMLYMTNTASKNLNILAVKRVLHAPMAFMDTTPMGRILNRFTKDTDSLDNELGDQIRLLVYFSANICGILILCIIYLPYFAIAIPFLIIIFMSITDFYQGSAREIKRLEAVQRSFVYNNFNEALNGMNTIKAYKADTRFLTKNSNFINKMNEAYFITIANQRWLAIHLDMVASLIAMIVTFLCVFRVFNISASSVGLLLSYILQIAGTLSMLIRTLTQVENEMNSVERMCHYAYDLPGERPYLISETTPSPDWPQRGAISFDNVSLAYREGLPLVLKKLTMDIKASEKIGICGRTGAGKSSIMTALYRLSEMSEGKIEIDGVDISTLGLKSLRSKLSIIPQDPVLFKGSIRKNLDPFGEHPDDKLWDAMRRTGLIEDSKMKLVKNQVKDLENEANNENLYKFHLDQTVDDEGTNFSLGERQLIAFARALVRDSKILILDEATSSVDYETDNKIQQTIIKEFSHCTILCIAHRLKTILNYDKILVLDKGEIKEFDTPWNLFNSTNSIFQQMCERSNITEQDFPPAS